MPFEDLRGFLNKLEKEGELKKVKVEVELEEIPPITKKMYDNRGSAVLFQNVKGYAIRVVTNVFGTRKRLAMAFETTEERLFDELLERRENLIPPEIVSRDRAPCKEVILTGDQIDITKLPVPIWSEGDGGPMITWPVLIFRDPELGRNAAMYRMQIKDKDRTTVRLSPYSDGYLYYTRAETRKEREFEIAVAIGVDPVISATSTMKVLPGVDEISVTGAFRGKPVKMVKCETVNLEVPYTAEIVIEGKVPIQAKVEQDGPFGEFHRYQSGTSEAYPFHITAITHRENPIYQACYEGSSIHNESRIVHGTLNEVEIYRRLKPAFPAIKKVHLPPSGSTVFHMIIQLDEKLKRIGSVKNILCAALAAKNAKHIVVVDDDINIYEPEEVNWAIATRVQADRDVEVISGVEGSTLDPSAKGSVTAAMLIDATKKPDFRGKPIKTFEKAQKKVEARWEMYGL